MTEKKNNDREKTAANKRGQGDSLERPNIYVPEGFEEKLHGAPKKDAPQTRRVEENGGRKNAPGQGRGQRAKNRPGQSAPNGAAEQDAGKAGGPPSGQKEQRVKSAPALAAPSSAPAGGAPKAPPAPETPKGTGNPRGRPKGWRKPQPQGGQPAKTQSAPQNNVQSNTPKNAQNNGQNNTPAKDAPVKEKTRDGGGRRRRGGQDKKQQPGQAAQPVQSQAQPQPLNAENQKTKSHSGRRGRGAGRKPPLKIISLGGLGEIGKNITVYECENDIVIVDCGLAFPDDDMLGVDLVIPDFTYLERNKEKIRGIFITHGHEDHIGGLAYLLKQINIPVYGTPLTMGLIQGKLKEHGILNQSRLSAVKAGDTVRVGCMSVEFIHVNHSIPDACALAIHTPAGVVIQTGDFKIDYTPIQGQPIDLVRFGELGSKGVLALLCDSTNAEKPGSTASERTVGESFDKLFKDAAGKRIIVATFASNIHRIQQIIDTAMKTGRKVAMFGRSMLNVSSVASELGYLNAKPGTIIDIDQMGSYTDDQLVVVCTGSQGEPMSALTRMSMGDHRQVHVGAGDYIIISATPIPGNEKLVGRVVNDLMKLGADVIYEKMYDVHVSGHACQDEIKAILSITRPQFYVPVHGEYKHLMKNAGIARAMGIDPKRIIISDIGKVIETDGVEMKISGIVPAGRVLVDGLGVGDVGSIVLKDRKLLSEEGLIIAVVTIDAAGGEILSGPDLVSRGFVYVRESEEMMTDARAVVLRSLEKCKLTGYKDWGAIKGKVKDDLSDFIYLRTKRRPMILPVIQEV